MLLAGFLRVWPIQPWVFLSFSSPVDSRSLPGDVAGGLPEGVANPTLGLPLCLFPCGFQVTACLVMLLAGFLRVWPVQPWVCPSFSSPVDSRSQPGDVAGRLPEGVANPTLGLSLFLFPCGFQVTACLVMLLGGFLRVSPIQPWVFPSSLPLWIPGHCLVMLLVGFLRVSPIQPWVFPSSLPLWIPGHSLVMLLAGFLRVSPIQPWVFPSVSSPVDSRSQPGDGAGGLPEGVSNPTLGLPLCLFPCGFQVTACLVMLLAGTGNTRTTIPGQKMTGQPLPARSAGDTARRLGWCNHEDCMAGSTRHETNLSNLSPLTLRKRQVDSISFFF